MDLTRGVRRNLRQKAAEFFSQEEIRLQNGQLLLTQGWKIHGILNDTPLEEMGDLVGNGNRDVDLCLVCCGSQVRGANNILTP